MNDEERDIIKALLAVKEAKEAQLILDLRAVRGQIEELRRKLKRGE